MFEDAAEGCGKFVKSEGRLIGLETQPREKRTATINHQHN